MIYVAGALVLVVAYMVWTSSRTIDKFLESVNALAKLNDEERERHRQELQLLFNRIQAPDLAVADADTGSPEGSVTYDDDELDIDESELEEALEDANAT